MKKVYKNSQEALAGLLFDGMTIMSGGFGICGVPENLIKAIKTSGVKNLTIISNGCGIDGYALGILLEAGQIKKMVSSYIGGNKYFEQLYLQGGVELEFNPQGTLAERIRAGGAGIPAFFVRTGVGTVIAEGKEERVFEDGHKYIMEKALKADLAIVKGYQADPEGNTVFRKTARNFNPIMAMAADVAVVEVEEILPTGSFDPDHIHLPGIYVKRLVKGEVYEKKIEHRTIMGMESH